MRREFDFFFNMIVLATSIDDMMKSELSTKSVVDVRSAYKCIELRTQLNKSKVYDVRIILIELYQ